MRWDDRWVVSWNAREWVSLRYKRFVPVQWEKILGKTPQMDMRTTGSFWSVTNHQLPTDIEKIQRFFCIWCGKWNLLSSSILFLAMSSLSWRLQPSHLVAAHYCSFIVQLSYLSYAKKKTRWEQHTQRERGKNGKMGKNEKMKKKKKKNKKKKGEKRKNKKGKV